MVAAVARAASCAAGQPAPKPRPGGGAAALEPPQPLTPSSLPFPARQDINSNLFRTFLSATGGSHAQSMK